MKIDITKEPYRQPEGTYRFALNAVTDPSNLTALSNERSNRSVGRFSGSVIGKIILDKSRTVFFTSSNAIYLFNAEDESVSLVVQDDRFDFADSVGGVYRQVRGCEDIIYFFDGKNPDRFYNLSRPEKHHTNGVFDIEKTRFNLSLTYPSIETKVLPAGGNLPYGVYHFALEFLTENEDTLLISPVSIDYTPVIKDTNRGGYNDVFPVSNSAIEVSILNIPEEVSLVRLVVFRHITGDGFTYDAHVVGRLYNVTSNTLKILYRGYNPSSGDFLVDPNQYLRRFQIYQSSFGAVQVDNRLLRYNLKESVKDYSNYQKFASKVKVEYVVDRISKSDPEIALKNKTFTGGEIILPCIHYVHRDGTISNAFPLVNRPKRASDATIVPNTAEPIQIGITITNVVFNDNTVSFDYELTELPVDLQFKIGLYGFQFVPISTLSGSVSVQMTSSNFLSVQVYLYDGVSSYFVASIQEGSTYQSNVDVISGETEKWRIYDTSESNGSDPQFFDAGLFGYYEIDQTYDNPPNYGGSDYWGEDFEGNLLTGTSVRLFVVPDRSTIPHEDEENIYPIGLRFSNIEYPDDSIVGHFFSVVSYTRSNIIAKGILFHSIHALDPNDDSPIASLGNTYVHGVSMVSPTTFKFLCSQTTIRSDFVTAPFLHKEGNYSYTTDIQGQQKFEGVFEGSLPYNTLYISPILHTMDGYTGQGDEVTSIQENFLIDPRSSVFNTANLSHTNRFHFIRTNAAFSVGSEVSYVSLRDYTSPIQDIWNIVTRRISKVNENVTFRGNSFISPINVSNIHDINIPGRSFFQTITFQDTDIIASSEFLFGFHVEGPTNNYLRGDKIDICEKVESSNRNLYSFTFERILEPYESKFKLREIPCPFFPGYNEDYSYIESKNAYTSFRFTHDFASACTGLYPNRIIFSPKSFQNDLSDAYRVHLPNDFVDIPSQYGPITAVDYRDGKLFVRTHSMAFIIKPNPQQLTTDESNVYIGTGDFLSIPAQELVVTPTGFGGQKHRFSSINCDQVLIWIDESLGRIYSISNDFEEISIPLEPFLSKQEVSYYLLGYDPHYRRILVTGKDAFTLSYCFKVRGWKSYHSYIPDMYSNTNKALVSFYDSQVWIHDGSKFNQFYNFSFPFIAEYILKSEGRTFFPKSIFFFSRAFDYSKGYEQQDDFTTFTRFLAYNDRQSTGYKLIQFNNPDNVTFIPDEIHVKRVNDYYRISPIVDRASSSDIWITDISSIKVGNNQGYIDKIPNIDNNVNGVDMGYFRSPWMAVRLIYDGIARRIVLSSIFKHEKVVHR